jgi:hypothetical protein
MELVMLEVQVGLVYNLILLVIINIMPAAVVVCLANLIQSQPVVTVVVEQDPDTKQPQG